MPSDTASPSSSGSQTSPRPSPSWSAWSGLWSCAQLSDVVGDAVAVEVRVADVAHPVEVEVGLGRVRRGRAVVGRVGDAVAVAIGVAGVALAVAVARRPGPRSRARAVVHAVEHAVVVVVRVADVAHAVALGVGLVRVREQRAVVDGVGHRVRVVVRVAGVAHAVAVGVGLVGVRVQRAVVGGVGHGVAVVVRIAGVAHAVERPCRPDRGSATTGQLSPRRRARRRRRRRRRRRPCRRRRDRPDRGRARSGRRPRRRDAVAVLVHHAVAEHGEPGLGGAGGVRAGADHDAAVGRNAGGLRERPAREVEAALLEQRRERAHAVRRVPDEGLAAERARARADHQRAVARGGERHARERAARQIAEAEHAERVDAERLQARARHAAPDHHRAVGRHAEGLARDAPPGRSPRPIMPAGVQGTPARPSRSGPADHDRAVRGDGARLALEGAARQIAEADHAAGRVHRNASWPAAERPEPTTSEPSDETAFAWLRNTPPGRSPRPTMPPAGVHGTPGCRLPTRCCPRSRRRRRRRPTRRWNDAAREVAEADHAVHGVPAERFEHAEPSGSRRPPPAVGRDAGAML